MMRFRPCIDIHHGKVKQIVGGTLSDQAGAQENFVSEMQATDYAVKYAKDGLTGGHIILLDPAGSDWYREDRKQALKALGACPGTLQLGGSVTEENAGAYLDAGASHVIVTSYVFSEGRIDEDALERMIRCVGKEHLVLDLSCKRRADGAYVIVTDRWQRYTDVVLCEETAKWLAGCCDEFLIHAADVEGRQEGPEQEVVQILARCGGYFDGPNNHITYAGGIRSFEDIDRIRQLGEGKIDFTIGSALDLFGGSMEYEKVIACCSRSMERPALK